MASTVYARSLGLFRNPAVRRELATLNPETDYERIVHLLVAYEFPFDITRALELALFHTFASPSVSGLLARTGEFEHHGQKRYDDTNLLIAQFMQDGLDSETGRRAISHMNRIHGMYRIPNDDFLFVLATFVFYPIDWLQRYGWRPLTASEEQALFLFFRETGKRMGMHNVPETIQAMKAFTEAYETKHFRYTESNARIADSTVRIVEGWFPSVLHPVVKPTFAALISDSLRNAFGYRRPAGWFCALLQGAFWIRKWPLRWITFQPYPKLVEKSLYRSYPAGTPPLEQLGPNKVLEALNGKQK